MKPLLRVQRRGERGARRRPRRSNHDAVAAAPGRRRVALTWGSICAALFLVLATLVLGQWQPLQSLDTWVGTRPERLTYDHEWLRQTALTVQGLFQVRSMTVLSVGVAVLLYLRRYPRAAGWVVLVMVASSLLTNLSKAAVGRDRPVWQLSITTLRSSSFPSGHSSAIASAVAVTTVLTLMLVRRRALRRAIIGAAVLVALLVGADRVFLGVHNLSDVLAGFLLGAAVPLLALALLDPAGQAPGGHSPRHRVVCCDRESLERS